MKNNFKIKSLYLILDFLIQLESLLWDISEIIIKPVAWVRRQVADKLSKIIK